MRLPALLPGYERCYVSEAGGGVDVHETHGKQEMRQNLPIAVFLANLGECVCLLPVLNEHNIKSADAARDGVVWEFKNPVGRSVSAIDNALRGAQAQSARVLLQLPADFDLAVLEQAIYGRVRRTVHIAEVALLLGNNLHHFFRAEIIADTFRGKMG